MGDPTPDLMDATNDIFVLAFDLVDCEMENLPAQIKKALDSKEVYGAITKTLTDFANAKTKTNTTTITTDEAKKLAESLQKGVTDAASDQLLKSIKATPEYKKLEASIDAFQKAAKSSSIGVWVDKNKSVLYVVGAVLVAGTAGVLYYTKTGGSALDTALSPLMGQKFKILQIGQLTLKASVWQFKPDARILGARVFGTGEWEKVKLEFNLGVLAEGTKVQQVEGGATLKSGPVNINFTANAKPQTQVVNLGLKIGCTAGNFDLGVGAMYQDSLASANASINYKTKDVMLGLQGNVGERKEGGVQYGALFTVTIPIR